VGHRLFTTVVLGSVVMAIFLTFTA
jgi:hypothetical protein